MLFFRSRPLFARSSFVRSLCSVRSLTPSGLSKGRRNTQVATKGSWRRRARYIRRFLSFLSVTVTFRRNDGCLFYWRNIVNCCSLNERKWYRYDMKIRTFYDYIQFHLTLSRSSDFGGLIFSIKKRKKKETRVLVMFQQRFLFFSYFPCF